MRDGLTVDCADRLTASAAATGAMLTTAPAGDDVCKPCRHHDHTSNIFCYKCAQHSTVAEKMATSSLNFSVKSRKFLGTTV